MLLFECAIENDLCWKKPAKHSTFRSTARKHEKKGRPATDEQIELAKAFTRDTMPEVALLLETGLRRGELLGLMWSDFDEREQTLSVRRSMALKHGVVTVNPPKWDSYRTLPLSREAVQLIHALPHDSLYLFPNANGEPHSPNSWSPKLGRCMCRLNEEHPSADPDRTSCATPAYLPAPAWSRHLHHARKPRISGVCAKDLCPQRTRHLCAVTARRNRAVAANGERPSENRFRCWLPEGLSFSVDTQRRIAVKPHGTAEALRNIIDSSCVRFEANISYVHARRF